MYHTQIWYLDNSHLQHVFVFGIKITFIHGIFCIQHYFKNTCIGIFGILYQLLKINYISTLRKNLSYLELLLYMALMMCAFCWINALLKRI